MDVLNEQQIREQIIDPALTRLNNETLPATGAALSAVLTPAIAEISNVLNGVLQGLQATADKAVADLHTEIAALDGWTVEIGPISIPPITIRLSAPKQ